MPSWQLPRSLTRSFLPSQSGQAYDVIRRLESYTHLLSCSFPNAPVTDPRVAPIMAANWS
jgi:hypothetical protein